MMTKVYWIIGPSGSGKTTLAHLLYQHIKKNDPRVLLLDGDELREIFGNSLGYSLSDREENSFRNARLCAVLAKQEMNIICATIAPFQKVRDWNRKNINNYVEIYLRVPIKELSDRDPKGLYADYFSGKKTSIVGLDIPFEEPITTDLVIDNFGKTSINDSLQLITNTFIN